MTEYQKERIIVTFLRLLYLKIASTYGVISTLNWGIVLNYYVFRNQGILSKYAKWFLHNRRISLFSEHVFPQNSKSQKICSEIICPISQCPRTDWNKRFLPGPKTITAWKLIPHRSKISKKWNPLRWVPLHRFFKNLFLLRQKQLYSGNHCKAVFVFLLIKKVPRV